MAVVENRNMQSEIKACILLEKKKICYIQIWSGAKEEFHIQSSIEVFILISLIRTSDIKNAVLCNNNKRLFCKSSM